MTCFLAVLSLSLSSTVKLSGDNYPLGKEHGLVSEGLVAKPGSPSVICETGACD